jgi:peptidoglycan/LPS O-acetylase OafA/YrhL
VLGASGIAFVVAAVHYGSTEGGWGPGQSLLGFPRVTFSFFAGVTLCRYRPSGVALPRASGNTVLLTGTAALLLILHGPAWSWGLCYELAAIFAVFPILVLALSQAQPGRRSIACCRFAGAVSYPVYLLQVPLMLLITAIVEGILDRQIREFAPALGVIELAAAILVAWAAVRYYEEPLRQYLRSRLWGEGGRHDRWSNLDAWTIRADASPASAKL